MRVDPFVERLFSMNDVIEGPSIHGVGVVGRDAWTETRLSSQELHSGLTSIDNDDVTPPTLRHVHFYPVRRHVDARTLMMKQTSE